MERYLSIYEKPARGEGVLKNNDAYFSAAFLGGDLHLYAARVAPAIQHEFGDCHCKGMKKYYRLHEALGLKREYYGG